MTSPIILVATAVAEAKNYSHAAKSLFVTQPTLSQSIKKLEAELNTILFLQNGRQLALTEAGEILYEKGQLLMTNFNQMVTEIQQLNQEKKEGIRVGLTSLFAIQFMKQISTFMATHSNVEVSLIQDGSRKLQELLAKGKIDIGLLSFPSTRNDITIEPLQTSTKGYPEIELNDLRDYKVASLNEHYMLGEMLPRKCRALGFDPHIVFKHNDWEVLIHSLQDLNAVTILPSEFESISQVQDLCWVPLKDKNNFYPIGIAYRNDTSFSPMIEEFLSLLKTN
ncbi:LysR family transcriptional regulator [Streptococcus agalactiae]|nr:LysR family transcriptional regulator [Streptococcus agalactiae]MCC9986151.1 LysR family transcriptional regulator [Streptococcus agalactiae]MCC9989632.1 LysR family transcriptional regulator [Streptococcus agalactiae]MCC9993610.1 LysR family transcriptional regulator [Streptococcus agalactiae]OZV88995.1 LysR family transcriptional regulator [Streptococcus agalactiae]